MALIKEVVSVSLGSSSRDHEVIVPVGDQQFRVRRMGTNGDRALLKQKLIECDKNPDVAAIGIGGCDIFLNAADRRFYFREILDLVSCVEHTPVVDGSGLKGAVEGDTVRFMQEELGIKFEGTNILVTSAIDRWGLAMACADVNSTGNVGYGDLLYALDVPVIVHGRKLLTTLARIIMPVVAQLPFSWIYPSESDASTEPKRTPKTDALYRAADLIVGDYKYVIKFMPPDLSGTIVVTNTTTPEDITFLHNRGVKLVVTTTPRLDGRSFGTNVIEALLVAAKGAQQPLEAGEYLESLKKMGFAPSVHWASENE